MGTTLTPMLKRHNAYLSLRGLLRPRVGADCGFEAAQLLSHICDDAPEVNDAQWRALLLCVARRAKGEPLQYIIGRWAFYGLDFFVSPAALIPRPESEFLVETFLSRTIPAEPLRILDLCCGTGCIGIAVAKKLECDMRFADLSADALALAQKNAVHHGIPGRFVLCDLFENITERFDAILCNPPYLSDADLLSLQKELEFEPRMALYGGADGLDSYRQLRQDAPAHLAPGGALYMEIGATQAEAIRALFEDCEIINDLENRPRVAIYKPKS